MLKIIGKILRSIADRIDEGSISSNAEETMKVMEALKQYTDREVRLSKYQSCQYLNISRASFDNYIRSGKLPKGKKQAGFKELSWAKKDLDKFINDYRNEYSIKEKQLSN